MGKIYPFLAFAFAEIIVFMIMVISVSGLSC